MFGSADRDVTRLLVVSTAASFATLYCATTISFEHYCKITGLDEQFLFASGLLFFSSISESLSLVISNGPLQHYDTICIYVSLLSNNMAN